MGAKEEKMKGEWVKKNHTAICYSQDPQEVREMNEEKMAVYFIFIKNLEDIN